MKDMLVIYPNAISAATGIYGGQADSILLEQDDVRAGLGGSAMLGTDGDDAASAGGEIDCVVTEFDGEIAAPDQDSFGCGGVAAPWPSPPRTTLTQWMFTPSRWAVA
jgi:hypothetical protein